jgi:hypothetical protein
MLLTQDRLEAVMNLLRNGLLMRKTEPRRRTVLTEKLAFPCGLSAEFITLSRETPNPQRPLMRTAVFFLEWLGALRVVVSLEVFF